MGSNDNDNDPTGSTDKDPTGTDEVGRPAEAPNPLYTRIHTTEDPELSGEDVDDYDDDFDETGIDAGPRESRGVETRLVAAEVVGRVLDDGAYVQHALGAALRRSSLGPRDRGFATELSYGTLTWLRPIDKALERLLDRGIGSVYPDLLQLLRVGAYQLGWRKQEVPDFAVIHETVDAARSLRGRGKANFVNAILRSMQRDLEIVFNPPKKATGAPKLGHTHSVPDWVAERLIGQLGEDDAMLALEAWNRPTPVHVRWREGLGMASESLTPHPTVPGAYIVDSGALHDLAELHDGRVSVQDAGAQ
ncbi:MAG: 16S rRNA (cytosine967-C5)-methyltransferase, partial [Flavobacteriales bacterium]